MIAATLILRATLYFERRAVCSMPLLDAAMPLSPPFMPGC